MFLAILLLNVAVVGLEAHNKMAGRRTEMYHTRRRKCVLNEVCAGLVEKKRNVLMVQMLVQVQADCCWLGNTARQLQAGVLNFSSNQANYKSSKINLPADGLTVGLTDTSDKAAKPNLRRRTIDELLLSSRKGSRTARWSELSQFPQRSKKKVSRNQTRDLADIATWFKATNGLVKK